MNILYIINYAGKGGTEKYIQTLTENKLPEDNIFFIYSQSGELCQKMQLLGVEPIHVKMRHPFDILAAKRIATFCKTHKIDIIHTQFQRENYIAILTKLFYPKVRIVYTCHINLKNNLIWKLMNRIMTKGDDAIIAVCSLGRELLVQNQMPKDKIELIYNGIPYEPYTKGKTKQQVFTFITVTRFSAEKGIFFLLDSIHLLKNQTTKPFQVIFVGDGPLFQEAKDYTNKLQINDFIFFAGYRTDTPLLLENADVFINSSESECLSFAILEAMGKALPVIATNVGGNPDIINSHTNCGVLVEYNNPTQMASAMEMMLNHPEKLESYSVNALKSVQNTFNLDLIIQQTHKIYKYVRRK